MFRTCSSKNVFRLLKDMFKPFLIIKDAGTVFVFSLALDRMSSHMLQSAIADSLTLASQK